MFGQVDEADLLCVHRQQLLHPVGHFQPLTIIPWPCTSRRVSAGSPCLRCVGWSASAVCLFVPLSSLSWKLLQSCRQWRSASPLVQ